MTAVPHRRHILAILAPLLAWLPAAAAPAQSNSWSKADSSPAPGFVWFDAARQRVMLLDYATGQVSTLDRGAWRPQNGLQTWTRFLRAIGYDPLRRQVLFTQLGVGGPPGSVPQTFTFDGQFMRSYTGRGTAAPPSGQFVFDPVRGEMIGFGSSLSFHAPVAETWTWNGSRWQQLTVATAPSARFSAAMATDRTRNRIVLFGGMNTSGLLGDTWEWDGTQWSLGASGGPSPRLAKLAFDPTSGRVVMVGGTDAAATPLFDSYEWTGSQWVQRANVPTVFTGAADDGALLHAIADGNYTVGNDAWAWAGSWVRRVIDTRRPGHHQSAIAYDPLRDQVVTHGGLTMAGLDGATAIWDGAWQQLAATGPSGRFGAAALFMPARGRIVLFGGFDNSSALDDTWEWDGAAWTQLQPATRPSPRLDHAMATDGAGRVLLFGGSADTSYTQFLSDTWHFDGTNWTLLAGATGPAARARAAFAWDPVRQRAVLVGGFDATMYGTGDTWEFDGAAWQLRTATASPPVHSAVFDPSLGRVVAADFEGLWSWDGTTWTDEPDAPIRLDSHVLIHHVGRQRLMAFSRSPDRVRTFGPTPADFYVEPACGNGPAINLIGGLSPGHAVTIEVATVPNAIGLIGIGDGNGSLPIGDNCYLGLGAIAQLELAIADAHGLMRLDFALPNSLALRGLPAVAQAGVLDGGPIGGGSLTGALRAVVGD